MIDRAIIIVLDSFGVGEAPDAAEYGDVGSNTLEGIYNNSKLYCYDTRKKRITAKIDVPVSNMHLDGDSLYIVSAQWNYISMSNEIMNAIIDVKRREKVCDNFIKDGTDNQIKIPYGIMVNPHTKDIYVTDAKNYVNPGYLHCYSQDGIKKWSVRTGDIPAHFVFLGENINEQ